MLLKEYYYSLKTEIGNDKSWIVASAFFQTYIQD